MSSCMVAMISTGHCHYIITTIVLVTFMWLIRDILQFITVLISKMTIHKVCDLTYVNLDLCPEVFQITP